VLQIYPENASQLEMISAAALRSGFSGGLVVDYPHRWAVVCLCFFAYYSLLSPPCTLYYWLYCFFWTCGFSSSPCFGRIYAVLIRVLANSC
jgi:hypothetical protein